MVTLTPLHSVLDRMITISRAMDSTGATAQLPVWFPALDMHETDNTLVVTMDVPGVRSEELDISFEKNTLTIRGSRPTLAKPAEGEFKLYASERVFGEFSRSVRLPQFVDAEKIEAEVKEGVLTVKVPKSAAALPRKISIKG